MKVKALSLPGGDPSARNQLVRYRSFDCHEGTVLVVSQGVKSGWRGGGGGGGHHGSRGGR